MDLVPSKRTNMIKFLLMVAFGIMAATGSAQLVINSQFKPLSYEELMLQAQAEAYRQQKMKERFEEYQDRAYNCYNRGDYNGFI